MKIEKIPCSCFYLYLKVVTPVQDNNDEEELSDSVSALGLVEDGDKAAMDSDYEEEKYMKEGNILSLRSRINISKVHDFFSTMYSFYVLTFHIRKE